MKNFLLLVIILIAFSLRFYKLDAYPALNADEAAIGYNAYSLLQTGKDEHGNPWPIHFQSFNDYKPGLYFYLVMPFVATLGLNEWSVRIPGALLGVATVLVLYLLSKRLFSTPKWFPYLAAFFLAISPWHIHFSRGGWEVNVATFFITLGVYAFLRAETKSKWYFISLLSFVASLYTYHAARVIVPVLGLVLLIGQFKKIMAHLPIFIVAALLAFVITVPLIIDFTGSAGISRATGVGLFADPGPLSRINEQRGQHLNYISLPAKLLHNKAVNYGLAFLDNYTSHFWGEFLFLSGDEIQRNRVPETGQLYLHDALFIIVGLLILFKANKNKLIFWWLLIAPIAASLTFQSPHALRAQNMVIPLVLLSALGASYLIDELQKRKLKTNFHYTIYCFIFLFMAWNASRYFHMYWVHMAKEYTFSSQYGVKELAEYVKVNMSSYKRILITDRYDQPYILMLFYLEYSPSKFQAEHSLTSRDQYGFSTVREFDKFYFGSIDFDSARPENPDSLLVGTDEEIPKEANITKKIFGSNGHLYFEAVSN